MAQHSYQDLEVRVAGLEERVRFLMHVLVQEQPQPNGLFDPHGRPQMIGVRKTFEQIFREARDAALKAHAAELARDRRDLTGTTGIPETPMDDGASAGSDPSGDVEGLARTGGDANSLPQD